MSNPSPLDFVLWLNGAMALVGDEPPSKEQWEKIHDKLGEVIGKLAADRLLDKADGLLRREKEQALQLQIEVEAKKAMYERMKQMQRQQQFPPRWASDNNLPSPDPSYMQRGYLESTAIDPELAKMRKAIYTSDSLVTDDSLLRSMAAPGKVENGR